jgi:hypothetical protein
MTKQKIKECMKIINSILEENYKSKTKEGIKHLYQAQNELKIYLDWLEGRFKNLNKRMFE